MGLQCRAEMRAPPPVDFIAQPVES
jgi:hypothetical protein